MADVLFQPAKFGPAPKPPRDGDKKQAGRLLDGREHNGFPVVTP